MLTKNTPKTATTIRNDNAIADGRLPCSGPGKCFATQLTGALSATAKKKAMNTKVSACVAFRSASSSTIVTTMSNKTLKKVLALIVRETAGSVEGEKSEPIATLSHVPTLPQCSN